MKKTIIHTDNAPAAIGPYSQAVMLGSLLFTSGQLGMNAKTLELGKGIEEQTRYSLQNVLHILEEAGSHPSQLVKVTVFLKNMDDFPIVNKIYEETLSHPYPARSCVEVARLPKDALVEIEAIALCIQPPCSEK